MDHLISELQQLLADRHLLRVENEHLKDQNLVLTNRLRAVNTARVRLRQRIREIL